MLRIWVHALIFDELKNTVLKVILFSFCDIEERAYLKDIQKLIDQKIPVVTKHPFANEVEEMPTNKMPTRGKRNFNKPLKRTKESNNKANRSKDKREKNTINNNEIKTFGESKNQNNLRLGGNARQSYEQRNRRFPRALLQPNSRGLCQHYSYCNGAGPFSRRRF